MSNTTKRLVVHALFEYTRTRAVLKQRDGQLVETEEPYTATALRGEVIEVNAIDLERGERLGGLIDGPLPTPGVVHPVPTSPEVAGGSEPQVVELPADGHLEPVDPASVAAATAANPVPMARPKQVAPVDTWREYAVKQGMSREEADKTSKQDLIDRYGAASTTSA